MVQLTEKATEKAGIAAASKDPVNSSKLAPLRAFVMSGLSLWLSLITLNNILDFGTNRALISKTITMVDLINDPIRGNGIQWRSLSDSLAAPALIGVTAYEVVAVVLMWWASALLIRRSLGADVAAEAVRRSNIALGAFIGLFFMFLCGGMWFAYWIYIGAAQQVHLTGLVIGLLAALLINLRSEQDRTA